ncbi:hypothetical protein ABMA27_000137, partial [Loxostege sticticalis]
MSFRKYYDTGKTSSYGRSRDSSATRATTTSSTDRPSSVTAKYLSPTPSYKSSIPVLRGERSTKDETPISAIANKYANYGKKDKVTPTYEKKDYTKLTVPVTGKSRETSPVSTSSKYKYSNSNGKSRDVSPVSKNKYSMSSIGGKSRDLSPVSSKYSFTRPSRHLSPGRQTTKTLKEKSPEPSPANRDKDIPSKTDKLSSYSMTSLYSNKHPRTSNYSRPASRAEVKPDITINRYAIASRLASNYSPTVKLSSVSPVNHSHSLEKFEIEKSVSPSITIKEEKADSPLKEVHSSEPVEEHCDLKSEDVNEIETETVIVITRHTSPTPPGSSAYVRSRRADMAKTLEKTITRSKHKPEMVDKEIQSDRLDDPTRSSRFGSTARSSVTSWSLYPSSSYTGYAGRYSTKYTTTRDNSSGNSYSDRTSRSTSTEPPPKENISRTHSPSDHFKSSPIINSTIPEANKEIFFFDEKKDDDSSNMSEMIINVNFTLKSPKILTQTTAELVSPEVTITNSLLPPQAPKAEGTVKIKKKIRKSSTDSSSDSSSKKKVVKKRSKSVSSSDSEQVSEGSEKNKALSSISPSKSSNKISSTSSLSKQKSRESNSPESSMTQSSMSEDEAMSRSKTVDISRTSADETSLPTDASHKQSSPIPPPRNDEGTEEAKSFLIRALGPVATLFKMRHQESNENSRWPDISSSDSTGKDVSNLLTESDKSSKTKNIIASNDDGFVQLKKIRHVESGERAWWLDSSSNIPEGIERLSPPRKSSSDSDKSEKYNFFKVRHIESGEKDWWLTSNSNETSSLSNNKDIQNSLSKSSSDQKRFPLSRIRHIESGERAWWLSSDKNIPEGIEKLPTPPPQEESDTSDSEEVQEYITPSHIPPFPLHLPDDEPLGDRRSPEGLETPKENEDFRGRTSPYENNHQYRRRNMYQKGMEKYISRYTDIDDILGTSGQIYSPFMDSILARRTGMPFEEECEEIDPTQVRIHDSTPQRPVITKLRGRNEIANYRGEDE